MSVPEGKTTAENVALIQENYTGSTRQQWQITETSNGRYKIKPRSASSSPDLVMAVGTGITSGTNIEQRKYVNDSNYKDEWELCDSLTHVYISLPARLFYDSSCVYTAEQLDTFYKAAVADFVTDFNIEFDLKSVSYASDLDCNPKCHASTLNDICTDQCFPLILCNLSHHRSSNRLITVLTSSSYYTYRLVGYAVCTYENGHDEVVGSGNINGKNSVTSTLTSTDIIRSIQHELTHNLGASHSDCISTQLCVLNGNMGEWCDACEETIKNNY